MHVFSRILSVFVFVDADFLSYSVMLDRCLVGNDENTVWTLCCQQAATVAFAGVTETLCLFQ